MTPRHALAVLAAGALAAVVAAPAGAAAQTVIVEGEAQYGSGANPPPGYGNPPPGYGQPAPGQPGYGQPAPQQQPRYAPTYRAPQRQVRYVERETNITGLWIPGIIIFGVSYALSATFGALGNSDFSTWMYVPLVGPWGSLAYANNDDETTGAIIGGIGQLAGVTMFILGLTLTRTVRVATYALDDDDARSPTLGLSALPTVGGAQLGVTLEHF